MLPVQQPDLASMFGQFSVGPTVVGYDREQQAIRNNNINVQQALADEQRNAEKHPVDMESALQLARQRRLTSDLAEKEQPFKLAEVERKGSISADEDQAKGLERAGLVFKQAGALAKANGGKIPLQYQQYFHPEMLRIMDSMTPEQMTEHGDAIFKNSKSYLGQDQKQEGLMQIQELKAQVERYKADQRRAGMAEAARIRNEALTKAAAAKASGKGEVALKTLDQAFIHFSNLAANAEDPESRSFYMQQAQQMSDQKFNLVTAAAQAKEAGKIDTGRVADLPVKAPPVAPKVNPPSKGDTQYKKDDKGRIILD